MKSGAPVFFIKTVFILLCIAISVNSFAQDRSIKEMQAKASQEIKKEEIDSGKVWKTGGVFNLNFGQGSQSNWSAGGDDFSLSIASYVGFYAFYKKERYSWDNTIDLNYGLVNTTSQGTRKNDDRIDLMSKVGCGLTKNLSLTGLVNFHSQFSKGYNYNSDGSREILSDFMAPGYVLVSMGMDYKPAEGLSIFISPVTSRWTFVNDDSLSSKGAYGVVPGKRVKKEIGAFSSITYLKPLTKTITYNGRLDLFSNYEHNPQNVDVMMNNRFTAKLTKVLSASLGLVLIYDDDAKLFGKDHDSPGLQLKQIIAAGISLKL